MIVIIIQEDFSKRRCEMNVTTTRGMGIPMRFGRGPKVPQLMELCPDTVYWESATEILWLGTHDTEVFFRVRAWLNSYADTPPPIGGLTESLSWLREMNIR